MNYQELEVKYYVTGLSEIERRVRDLNALLTQPRTLEVNLRFDTSSGQLGRGMQVLRLRQDTQARLTYKGPSLVSDKARLRQEIEFSVSDFAAARAFLEALGYQVVMIYEKYRCVYDFRDMHIALDELPYGYFVEIEGQTVEEIRQISQLVKLDWEKSVPESYTMLFERLRVHQKLAFRDLVFDNFRDLEILPEFLHVEPADS